MPQKTKLFFTALVFSLVTNVAVYAESPKTKTTWETVSEGMDKLLSSGWIIVGHGSNRVAVERRGSFESTWIDQSMDTFILHKGNKYIYCMIIDPTPGSAYSRCRRMN